MKNIEKNCLFLKIMFAEVHKLKKSLQRKIFHTAPPGK